jgi:phenylalanyl-tRNA synthetase alpha chain
LSGRETCNLSGTAELFVSFLWGVFYFEIYNYQEVIMENKIHQMREQFEKELSEIKDLSELEGIRVSYLGKKGSVTDLLKGMRELSNEDKKAFGQKVNELKGIVADKISEKTEQLKELQVQKEIELMPEFDLSIPANLSRGSYHPITLVQRQCEQIFKSMGFTVEDYSEVVTDYECFEAVNIPKNHPARDMQDTYYLENGQLLKSQTSAAQNAILRKYKKPLTEDGIPIKAIFPGRCFRNEATDACHENTFFQMEGMMVDKDISISNLIYFMKTMLSEVFRKDIKVRLRPGFFPFVEPGFELDISCLICGGEGCPSCKHSGWLELCPCGMIHPEVLRMGGIDPEEYTGFAFGLGLTRLVMMKYGIGDIRDLNSGSLKSMSQFTDDE